MEAFRIGDWTIDPALNAVARGGATRRIEPRLMTLLCALARRRGEVVTRAELLAGVWPEAVAADEALTQAVSVLRRILGDDRRRPRFLETLPKRGYRLLDEPEAFADTPHRRRVLAAAAALAGITLAVSVAMVMARQSDSGSPVVRPVTALRGRESQPSLAPDGRRVAFVWNGVNGSQPDLYLADGSGDPQRLTNDAALEHSPAWSPDGRSIVFSSLAAGRCSIRLIDASGGNPRHLADCGNDIAYLAWSHDGARLVVAQRGEVGGFALSLLSVADGRRTQLTTPAAIHGDRFPVFSPDGRRIAFARTTHAGASDLFIMEASGGRSRRVTSQARLIAGLAWRDDDSLIVSSSDGGPFRLSEVALRGGRVTTLAFAGEAIRPVVVHNTIAFEELRNDVDIWRLEPDREPRRLVTSTRSDVEPQLSIDGRRIAFISTRSGRPQVWIARADGAGAKRLTNVTASKILTPRWSANASSVAFTVSHDGRMSVHVVSLVDSRTRAVTPMSSDAVSPTFARSGHALFFSSNRGGRWRVWRQSLGDGSASVVLDAPAGTTREANDGSLVFNRMDAPGLWMSRGGHWKRIVDDYPAGAWGNWDLRGDRLFFVSPRGEVFEQVLGSNDRRLVTRIETDLQGISVTPDGSILFTRADRQESDILLAELP